MASLGKMDNLVQEHRLNLSGGTENVKYFTGISYLDQPSIVKHLAYIRLKNILYE